VPSDVAQVRADAGSPEANFLGAMLPKWHLRPSAQAHVECGGLPPL